MKSELYVLATIIFTLFILFLKLVYLFKIIPKFNRVPEGVTHSLIPLYKIEWNSIVDENIHDNPTPFECAICLEENQVNRVSFDVCGKIKHNYCPNCIRLYGNTLIDIKNDIIQIPCPLCKTTLWSNV